MDLVSVPTVTLCIFIAMIAIGIGMASIWWSDRKEGAALLWSVAYFFGAFSGLVIAIMKPGSGWAITAACVLNITSFSFALSGFRVFGKRSPALWLCFVLPIALLLLHLSFPALRNNPNNAQALQSTLVMGLVAVSAYAMIVGHGNRELPLARVVAAFLMLHGIFHGANALHAYFEPAAIVHGRLQSVWLKIFMLEAFLNVIVIATACLMLIKERSEQRHRIASETDMLTGIANRRAFVQRTELALRNAADDAVLAVVDLDHFKTINDQYGHQTGDLALVEFARVVAGNLPQDALFGRIGGEEFAVFLPASAGRDAELALNDLRRIVEACTIGNGAQPLSLTVSVGAVTIQKAGANFDNLVAAADCALYAAKERGRNCVVMFTPSMRLLKVLEEDGSKRFGLAEQRISRRVTRTTPSRAVNS